MQVIICGVPHEIIEREDSFDATAIHFGQIDHKKCEIKIASDMSKEQKMETLCHEVVHGILVHIGYDDYSNNEQFVQALSNAIYQSFSLNIVN